MITKTQIDKIGERIRSGNIDEDLLRTLEAYRREFNPAYSKVESIMTDKMHCAVTGRPSKSTFAIVEKRHRQKTRLSQMQDIAGCRVIVNTLLDQDELVSSAKAWFPQISVDDKRATPNRGYRAVHLIVTHNYKPVEVQIRTTGQHFWAEMSEKISDIYGKDIKYGQGESWALDFLGEFSLTVADLDKLMMQKLLIVRQSSKLKDYKEQKRLQKRMRYLETLVRHNMYGAKVLFNRLEGR